MHSSLKTIALVLALQLGLFEAVVAAECRLSRDDAIDVLAEATIRVAQNLAPKATVDQTLMLENRRKILAQTNEEWKLNIQEEKGCIFHVWLENPNLRIGGLSVRVKSERRILEIFQGR